MGLLPTQERQSFPTSAIWWEFPLSRPAMPTGSSRPRGGCARALPASSLDATGMFAPCPTTVMRAGRHAAVDEQPHHRAGARGRQFPVRRESRIADRQVVGVAFDLRARADRRCSSTASACSASRESGVSVASPESNSTLALISTLTPRLFCVTRTLPSLDQRRQGRRQVARQLVRRSRSRRSASARRLAMMFGSGIAPLRCRLAGLARRRGRRRRCPARQKTPCTCLR